MRVRLLALVGLALCMSVLPVSAQIVVSRTDRSQIHACEGTPPPGVTVWHADRVGIDRLIPSMPGSDAYEVSKFFRGVQDADLVTPEEGLVLSQAKEALKRSIYQLFYKPDSQLVNGRRVRMADQPPDQFYNEVIEASLPQNLRQEVVPCWTEVLGLTYGTKIVGQQGQERFETYAIEGPVVIGWYQDGAFTADGRPGAKVTLTNPVSPDSGRFAGVPVQLMVFDICGNVAGRVSITEPVQVIAKATEISQMPQEPAVQQPAVKLPEKLPPLETAVPAVSGAPRKKPCTGKVSRWVCIGAGAVGMAFMLRRDEDVPVATSSTPIKLGGPGPRPQ